jgi:hypothetical protein
MLAVDEGSGGFLNRSAVHGLPGPLALAEPLSRGCYLGPYEIISVLGTGGMGRTPVWLLCTISSARVAGTGW